MFYNCLRSSNCELKLYFRMEKQRKKSQLKELRIYVKIRKCHYQTMKFQLI